MQRYAKAHWGDLNSPDAQAFMANFRQAFGGYPQHLDIDLLRPLPADGSIPSGKDVSLFVGNDGEVLVYARPPAPGGTGVFRGIYGLDGAPNGSGSTGLNFFQDGTPQPVSVQPHLATPSDPTGGIDVALPNGSREHWWQDSTDGFIRARQRDDAAIGRGYDTRSERLGHVPGGAVGPSTPNISPSFDDRFGNGTPSPGDVTTPNPDQPAAGKPMRYLTRRIAGASGASPFDTGAPAVPFVATTNSPLAPAPSASFADRFRASSGRAVRPNGGDAGQGGASTPGTPNPASAQADWTSGTAPGRPMPDYPVPPSVFDLRDVPAGNADDWFDRWIEPLLHQ